MIFEFFLGEFEVYIFFRVENFGVFYFLYFKRYDKFYDFVCKEIKYIRKIR